MQQSLQPDENYRGPVRDFEDLKRCFRLVHDNYVGMGYMQPHASSLRYSVFELLPRASTFIVCSGDLAIGTLSLVEDSFCGLPLERISPEHLEQLRAGGKSVAEATMFACRPDAWSMHAAVDLMEWVWSWCCLYGIDRLCIVVHPRHAAFWQRSGFQIAAAERACGHVAGAPGVLLELNVEAVLARQNEFPLSRRFRNCVEPERFVDGYLIAEEELLELLSLRPEIAVSLTRHQRAVLERFFPYAMLMADRQGINRESDVACL